MRRVGRNRQWHPMLALAAVWAVVGCIHAASDFELQFKSVPGGPDLRFMTNPSIALQPHGRYLVSGRVNNVTKTDAFERWITVTYVCEADDISGAAGLMECHEYDPWHGFYTECQWDEQHGPKKGSKAYTQVTGVEDLKMFHGPGGEVVAIFGRKPPQILGSQFCKGPERFQQWVVNMQAGEGGHAKSLPVPLRLLRRDPPREQVVEKNWMPFFHNGTLYAVRYIQPHKIVHVNDFGISRAAYETYSPLLDARFPGKELHGGPPILFLHDTVPPAYLGVLHYYDIDVRPPSEGTTNPTKVKRYRHFAYKMAAQPPFSILAVSAELPLQFSGDAFRLQRNFSEVAFVNGVERHRDGSILFAYGSRDASSRVLSMSLAEVESLFSQVAIS